MARRRNKGRNISGILLLDKPIGITSNLALQKVKRLFNANKAGHTGNLDPMASGLLPICLGEATKVSGYLLDSDKAYLGTIKLGERTNTADAEGEIIETRPVENVNEARVKEVLNQFVGEQEQIPPMHSAIKQDGQPLYKLAHQGLEVERKARKITIFSLDLQRFSENELDIEVHLVKENVVPSKASHSSEKFMHLIKLGMAKNYIDNLSEETKKGMREKAEQGVYPSYAPLGYLNGEENNTRMIQPDPVLGPQVRKLFEWYATGNYSLVGIARKAHEAGLLYRNSGKMIQKSTVHQLLKNPIYYGDFLWKGRLHHGVHEPLISKALFDRVQEVMAEKGHCRVRQKKRHWAFRGMLTCGHCGCALTAEVKKGRYVYFSCRTEYKSGSESERFYLCLG